MATDDVALAARPLRHLDNAAVHDPGATRRHGIEVLIVGQGRLWENFWLSKCVRLWEAIGERQEFEHIVFVDGTDLLFAAGLEELHDGFAKSGSDFVIAGEHICWPYSDLADHPAFDQGARFRYPCAGFWMATWPAFVRDFGILLSTPNTECQEDGQTIYNCDQARFQLGITVGSLQITIDTAQRLCQCLCKLDDRASDSREIEWLNPRRPQNKTTGEYPCTIHSNGTAKQALPRVREILTSRV